MKRDEQKVLERIANNDKKALDQLYVAHKSAFMSYFMKYNLDMEEIKDIYQETMVAFYQRGVQGKLKDLKSSIKTYVFGIGKHKVIDYLRKQKKTKKLPKVETSYEMIAIEKKELTKEQKKLYKQFSALSESCQRMLTLFYYRGLDIHEIAEIGSYKDANTVKSHKSRCLKQLKTLVNK